MLLHTLHAAGVVGLRSFLTGIPPALLLRPELALADATTTRAPQFVLFATSSNGDPMSCNVPGTYLDANVAHADHPSMVATTFALGDQQVVGAQIWSTMPTALASRFCFFHHASGTQVHGDEGAILKLRNATASTEALPVVLGRALQTPLGCLRPQPINLSQDAQAVFTFDSAPQPQYNPGTLATLLTAPSGGLGDQNLVALRDKTIDELSAWAKTRGRTFQARFLDDWATSQNQLRTLQADIITKLRAITGNTLLDQMKAALVLFQTKVCPVAQVLMGMGGDNHSDAGFLAAEVPQHVTSIGYLSQLPTLIDNAGLTDQVTFAGMNVFGRNLTVANTKRAGRNHHSGHAIGLLAGKHVKAGVVGGLVTGAAAEKFGDYLAGSFNASTGVLDDAGDVMPSDSLGSFGQTVMAAAGLSTDDAGKAITVGKVVDACLVA